MKPRLQKLLMAFSLFTILIPVKSFSQDLTGIWKGSFQTEQGQNYRLEFQIEQNKNHTITGVSYSYGENVSFYGKAIMTGNYAVSNGSFTIQETKTVEVKNILGGGTCLMNYRFTYSRSGREEFLDGIYVGKTEDRMNPKNNGKWGDCGGGTVHLRRVQYSDFYIEPFLRNKLYTPDTIAKTPEVKKTVKPQIKTRPKQLTKKPVKKTIKKPVAKKPPVIKKHLVIAKPKTDTTAKRKIPDAIVSDKPAEKPKIMLPATTRSRENKLVQTIIVTHPDINVRFYDNGEIDGDSISVYLDGKLIVSNQGLSTVPIKVHLKMNEDNDDHTLVMVAENMGRIPPNTALMIVEDGDKRYQVGITTTEQKNAMVRFRFQKNK